MSFWTWTQQKKTNCNWTHQAFLLAFFLHMGFFLFQHFHLSFRFSCWCWCWCCCWKNVQDFPGCLPLRNMKKLVQQKIIWGYEKRTSEWGNGMGGTSPYTKASSTAFEDINLQFFQRKLSQAESSERLRFLGDCMESYELSPWPIS